MYLSCISSMSKKTHLKIRDSRWKRAMFIVVKQFDALFQLFLQTKEKRKMELNYTQDAFMLLWEIETYLSTNPFLTKETKVLNLCIETTVCKRLSAIHSFRENASPRTRTGCWGQWCLWSVSGDPGMNPRKHKVNSWWEQTHNNSRPSSPLWMDNFLCRCSLCITSCGLVPKSY